MALFWKAMAAKTPPALAPGAMTQLGLLGLAYAFRHPALGRPGAGGRIEIRTTIAPLRSGSTGDDMRFGMRSIAAMLMVLALGVPTTRERPGREITGSGRCEYRGRKGPCRDASHDPGHRVGARGRPAVQEHRRI